MHKTNIKLELVPITKLNKKLDQASKIISFNKIKSGNEAIKYLKKHKVEVFNLLDKHYKDYLDKFKGFEIVILVNNKKSKSLTFSYEIIAEEVL